MKMLALIFCAFLGLAGVVQAQQNPQQQILTMPVTAPCLPFDDALSKLSKQYGEKPFAQGPGVVYNSKIQEYIVVRVLIFLNPSNSSFTIAYEVTEDNIICILSTGDDFGPISRGQKL